MGNLFPNPDSVGIVNGVVTRKSEEDMAADLPRVDGTGSITVTGTVANGDVLTATFTSVLFSGGSLAVQATAQTGDSATVAAERLVAAINANATLKAMGVYAQMSVVAGKLDIIWPGPLGTQFLTLSASTTGAEGFTIVQMTGGSGPIIPLKSFNFLYNGSVISLVENRRKLLSNVVLAALVKGPQPII